MDEIHPSVWPQQALASRGLALERASSGSRRGDRVHFCNVGAGRKLLHWHGQGTNWFLLATPIVGSGSLLWYAWDTVTVGDRPLTTTSIQNIRQVVQGMMLEDAGAIVDWQHPDDQGSIPLRIE